jgi:hypothetical protein
MNESSVVCRVAGCQNSGIPIIILTDEIIPINVVCGPCGTEITDITLIEIPSDIEETVSDIDETPPNVES